MVICSILTVLLGPELLQLWLVKGMCCWGVSLTCESPITLGSWPHIGANRVFMFNSTRPWLMILSDKDVSVNLSVQLSLASQRTCFPGHCLHHIAFIDLWDSIFQDSTGDKPCLFWLQFLFLDTSLRLRLILFPLFKVTLFLCYDLLSVACIIYFQQIISLKCPDTWDCGWAEEDSSLSSQMPPTESFRVDERKRDNV